LSAFIEVELESLSGGKELMGSCHYFVTSSKENWFQEKEAARQEAILL